MLRHWHLPASGTSAPPKECLIVSQSKTKAHRSATRMERQGVAWKVIVRLHERLSEKGAATYPGSALEHTVAALAETVCVRGPCNASPSSKLDHTAVVHTLTAASLVDNGAPGATAGLPRPDRRVLGQTRAFGEQAETSYGKHRRKVPDMGARPLHHGL